MGSDAGLRSVLWEERPVPSDAVDAGCALLEEAARQLRAYFSGRLREFDLPLDLRGTAFQLAAWRALATLAYGTTSTYGEQALRLDRPRAARAVGAANGSNPTPIVLPCHRLVGADGSLVGFGGGLERKAWLLAHERAVAAGRRS